MLNIHTPCQILKQAKQVRRIARLISRNSLGPGPTGLSSLHDRLIQVYPEVAEAIVSRRPVVALESTIITHGMPYPENCRYVIDITSYIVPNSMYSRSECKFTCTPSSNHCIFSVEFSTES